jgi:hypothetical protein
MTDATKQSAAMQNILEACEGKLMGYVVWGRDDESDAALRAARTALAIKAITGRTIAANTIRTHIKNSKGRTGKA